MHRPALRQRFALGNPYKNSGNFLDAFTLSMAVMHNGNSKNSGKELQKERKIAIINEISVNFSVPVFCFCFFYRRIS